MIEKNTIVTLDDDKDYIVTSVIEIGNDRFAVLFEVDNVDNRKICIEEMVDGKLALTELPDCEENKEIFLKIITKLIKELEEQE